MHIRSCAGRTLDGSHPLFVQYRNVGLIRRVAHLHRRARLETIVDLLVDLLRLPVAHGLSLSVGCRQFPGDDKWFALEAFILPDTQDWRFSNCCGVAQRLCEPIHLHPLDDVDDSRNEKQ